MAEVKWVKLKINMFEDDKIEYIESIPESDTILVIWFKLLALAGKCNFGGFIHLTEDIPYTADMLSHKFRRPINTIKLALATFEKLGMIDIIDGRICLADFSSEQNEAKLSEIRDYNRKAKQNERARKKLLLSSNEIKSNSINEMSMTNVNDSQGNCQINSVDNTLTCHTCQNTDEDIDKDIDKDYIDDDNDINNIFAMAKKNETTSSTLLSISESMCPEAFYELNIGKINTIVKQGIDYYLKQGISEGVVRIAIMTAVSNSTETKDKRNWSYISAILDDCIKRNIKTIEEYYAKEIAFQQKKQKQQSTVSSKFIDTGQRIMLGERNKSSGVDVIGQHAFRV